MKPIYRLREQSLSRRDEKSIDSYQVFWYYNTRMSVNSIIHLSDAALIAVHALAGLAEMPGRLVQTRDLAAIIAASESHVAKVMQRLAKADLVRSVKGPSGGFELAKPADEISFRNAIEAVDGSLTGDFCPFRTDRCNSRTCIFGREISKHAAELVAYLDSRSIADILKEQTVTIPAEYIARRGS